MKGPATIRIDRQTDNRVDQHLELDHTWNRYHAERNPKPIPKIETEWTRVNSRRQNQKQKKIDKQKETDRLIEEQTHQLPNILKTANVNILTKHASEILNNLANE